MNKQELCNSFYDMNNMVTVRITMPQSDWEELRNAEPYGGICNYAYTDDRYDWFKTTSVEIAGSAFPSGGVHSFESVAIGKKSYCGSFSTSKPALKLNFSKYVSSNEKAIEGLIGTQYVTLNNCVQDPSYIRQPLGYFLFKQAGLPYSRCNFAKVYVNGTDYGVYLNIEPIKKRHIQNNFNGNDEGNLYEIDEGEDFTRSIIDSDRISCESMSKYSNMKDLELATREISDNGLSGMARVIDTNQFLRFFAMEVLLKHWDGYTNKLNNTYIYNDVVAVKTPNVNDVNFKFIPWGVDRILQETKKFQLYDASVLGKLVFEDAGSLAKLKMEIRNYANTIFDRDNYNNVLSPYIDRMQNILTSFGLTELTSEIEVVREQLKLVRSGGFQLMGEFSPALV
ncbi:CotH kinase family protein [Methanosarcina sp. T3]|uniref:CotH kinase family protein n=1 Tax=Methanosarcina sp. T3 TaxID=3439062 RepID=UPI003F83D364